MKKSNTYTINGNVVIGKTRKGEKFTFDLEDYEEVKKYNWFLNNGYAGTNIRKGSVANGNYTQTRVQLHQLIMKPKKGYITDHINRDRSDNRRSNLRYLTYAQNNRNRSVAIDNTSGVTGVYWEHSKWRARIYYKYENKCLGRFESKEDAIKARRNAEIEYFGEYRSL